jgi:hypothetical protein
MSCACTLPQSARATGRAKKGIGWRGIVLNTSFITSQFISEPFCIVHPVPALAMFGPCPAVAAAATARPEARVTMFFDEVFDDRARLRYDLAVFDDDRRLAERMDRP